MLLAGDKGQQMVWWGGEGGQTLPNAIYSQFPDIARGSVL